MDKFIFSSGTIKTPIEQFFSLEHYQFKLLLFSSIFLLALKIFFSNNYTAIVTNSLLEFMMLFLLYILLFASKSFIGPERNVLHKTVDVAFYGLFFFNLIIFSLNSIFLKESLIMKYSLSNFDLNVVGFVFKNIIPWKYLFSAPLAIIALCWISSLNLKRFEGIESHFRKIFWVLLIATVLSIFFGFNSISNVYANTVHDKFFSNYTAEIHVSQELIDNANYSMEMFDNQIKDYSDYKLPKNQRVLMFVMEQTSYNAFMEDSSKIPKERSFFDKVSGNTHFFTNYYTTNQDSLTSIWTMLNSNFLPFECYITDWNKFYGFTLGSHNLVSLFNENNYTTHSVASVYVSGLIMGVYNWTNLTYLHKDTPQGKYFCQTEFEYEPSCEDNIILDDVKAIVKSHQNSSLFLVQEFIYGHGVIFEDAIHKTKTEYYNDYLLNLYDYMEKENLLENTTLIVVADHGEKGYFDKEKWNYHTPLMIINGNLDHKEINDLYSDMDFKDIVLSYLTGRELEQSTRPKFIIGQTQSSEIAYLDKEGKYFSGKLDKSNDFRLKESNGLNNEQITNLLAKLLKYQKDSIAKSSEENYWCSNCDANEKKAGL